MEQIKVAFVGIGGYGGTVLQEIFHKSLQGFEIVSVVDPYADRSICYDAVCKMGIPQFGSMEEMYKAGILPEFIVIATPIQYHTEQILCALEHGANVLCEKPVTGDKEDIAILEEAQKKSGKFVAIGYQWSYSSPIQKLKKDIMAGKYGQAKFLKSLVFWPRNKSYFKRSTGWAGKIYASNGKKICDSIVNNATAHYIHNMLYLLGKNTDTSMAAEDVKATLLRVNDIETFDTATVRFHFKKGAEGLLVVSHSTKSTVEPEFEYIFEKGKIVYDAKSANIRGFLDNAQTIEYGDPFAEGASNKFYRCLDSIRRKEKDVLCGIEAAKEQVYFVDKLHTFNTIKNVKKTKVQLVDDFLVVDGLDIALQACYRKNKLLEETDYFNEIIEKSKNET